MLKDWLLNLSVTFGLGWVVGLMFYPSNALWFGVQSTAVAVVGQGIVTRTKKNHFHKTSASFRSQISRLQAKSHALQHTILMASQEKDEIVTQLESYVQRRQAAEKHIAALEAARQRMTLESQQIETNLTELQAEQTHLEQNIAKVTAIRQHLLDGKLELKSEADTSKAALESAVAQLELARSQQLESLQQAEEKLTQLQSEQETLAQNIAQMTIDLQHLLDDNQELAVSRQEIALEIQDLNTELSQLESECQQYQSTTQELTATITSLNQDITHLEATKQELQNDLEQLLQEMVVAENLARQMPPPPEAVAETDVIDWPERFEDLAVRSVFIHLQKYGAVTEAELTQMLEGNPRKARQFALKFEEYLQLLPFKARVEIAASGKRYVRD